MYDDKAPEQDKIGCDEQVFKLSVYEAGHALTARALGLKIVSVRMFPRPPVLISDKPFSSTSWAAFIETLEIRVIELFGGQIAEEQACGSNSCCSGDIVRIDELCRLISGLSGESDYETTMFKLEDQAQKIFEEARFRDAILPMARYLHQMTLDGHDEILGADIEKELDKYVPATAKKSWLKRTFGGV